MPRTKFTGALCVLWAVAFFLLPFLSSAAQRPDKPEELKLLILEQKDLERARERVFTNDVKIKASLDELLGKADKALRMKAPSVMDKKLTPPSGDKHDYMSFGPYWWPNSNEPDGLPYVRKDGIVNPASKDSSTDPSAMGNMVGSVNTLALAYYLTDREAYAQKAAELLRTWFLDPATRMAPNMNFAQAVPGYNDGRGAGIIEAIGLAKMLDSITLLSESGHWTAKDQRDIVAWYKDFLQWLRISKNGVDEARARNNHGSWYDFTVSAISLFVNKPEIAKEVVEAAKSKRIDRQIEPDGSQPYEFSRTRSFDYSLYNLEALWLLSQLGDKVKVDLWHYESRDKRSLRKALDFLAPYVDSSKKWPHQQIKVKRKGSVEQRSLRNLPLILRGAVAIYPDGHYERYLSKISIADEADLRSRILYFD